MNYDNVELGYGSKPHKPKALEGQPKGGQQPQKLLSSRASKIACGDMEMTQGEFLN